MSRRNKRASIDANISFLDIICCGFGAIILLLVIVKPMSPLVLEDSPVEQLGQVRALQERLFEIRGQVDYLEQDLDAKQEQLGDSERRVALLRNQYEALSKQLAANEGGRNDDQLSVADLQIALQSLTQEMQALLKRRKANSNYIGGIPVDSEYVIFIIDTSGSMKSMAWRRLLSEVRSVLAIYPRVKGIQVMDDQGQYMFEQYRGQWIDDSPAWRRSILERLQNWTTFSNSSPEQGIYTAIRRHFEQGKKISLYVFGDDFNGSSISRTVDIISNLNQQKRNGDTLVRIHTVGFPVQFQGPPGINSRAMRYANLMRLLAEQNNGSFIGLNDVQ
jgi:hypothetical protein